MRALTASLLAVCSTLAVGAYAQTDAPRVQIDSGRLQGERTGKVAAFLGIPFAAAPVGDLRWRAPRPAATWTGVRRADKFGASCMQPVDPKGFGPWTHEYVVQNSPSEDCLFLNVWTAAKSGEKRPVVLWIHGGGFNSGSGSVPVYNGQALASRGVVIVTINYRIGVFGFLAHPELTREAGGSAPSNFGLQDQIAALRWVKSNIAAFGGDPAAVTIAGQSAGAMSVHSLVASPLAKGLFARAIAQSGLPGVLPVRSLADAERDGVDFARARRAESLADLRALSPQQLMTPAAGEAPSPFRFGPSVDGVLLPDDPAAMVRSGHFNDVPMIVGQNADEGSAMSPNYGVATPDGFAQLLKSSFGEMSDTFARLYHAGTDVERRASGKALLRDRGLAALWGWSQDRSLHGNARVYGYLFSHVEPGPESARYGAFHSSEIPYVLDTLSASPERPFSGRDRNVSLTMSSYWLNFAKTGNPNGTNRPAWPALDPQQPRIMHFGEAARVGPLLPAPTLATMREYLARGGRLSMF